MGPKIDFKIDEKILMVLRRHSVTLFWFWFFGSIFLITAFFLMFYLFAHDTIGKIGFLALIGIALLLILKGFYLFRKDFCFVTNHRIININKRGIFDTIVSEIHYDQVEGVVGRICGVWGTIFKYGDITIQTGANNTQITIEKIKNPIFVQQKINEARKKIVGGDEKLEKNNANLSKMDNSELLVLIKKAIKELKLRGIYSKDEDMD